MVLFLRALHGIDVNGSGSWSREHWVQFVGLPLWGPHEFGSYRVFQKSEGKYNYSLASFAIAEPECLHVTPILIRFFSDDIRIFFVKVQEHLIRQRVHESKPSSVIDVTSFVNINSFLTHLERTQGEL